MARRLSLVVAAGLLVFVWSAPALGDWVETMQHKMHYPQLPDPNGWDVKASYYLFLADDWQCSESGPVEDIHLWISWKDDQPLPLTQIHTAIWTDDRTDPNFSKPKERVWHFDWTDSWDIITYGAGEQGWFDPRQEANYLLRDHFAYYQINLLVPEANYFHQVKDTIYWLEVSFLPEEIGIGWKTSRSPHFEDDAVWRVFGETPVWHELRDPITGQTLDLAFVITPEPGTLALLAAGGGLLLARRRRRT